MRLSNFQPNSQSKLQSLLPAALSKVSSKTAKPNTLKLSSAVLSSMLLASGLLMTGCQQNTTSTTGTAEQTQTEHHDHKGHDNHADEHHEHGKHDHSHDAHAHDEHEHGHNHEHHDHEHPVSNVVLAPPQAADLALVTVSNYPLYLLSNAVTEGTPVQATMLLKPGNIGHHGSLTPEDKKTVQDSRYVVWFGNALEHNLTNTLQNSSNAISLLGMSSAFVRHAMRDVEAKDIGSSQDPHIWLDPNNAKAIVRALASIHGQANPQYTEQFQANADKFAKDMDTLAQRYHGEQPASYWAYHDAFQYIEDALNIQLAGTLTTDHEIPVKASQYVWLNNHRPNEQMCLLAQSTPQDGVINKLKPVHYSVHIEDMSDSQNFLQAWETIAKGINDCVRRA